MDAKEFFNTVREMRKAQRDYFRTRAQHFLVRSKDLEKAVDDEIERTEAALKEREQRKQLNFNFEP